MRSIPEAAITLVKNFEGCRLNAYRDVAGILTIGYGHTGKDVVEGMQIAQETADMLLASDLAKFANAVVKLTKVRLTDNQFSALLSFTFNVGAGAYQRSTLRQYINRGDSSDGDIYVQFKRWNRAAGKVNRGLTNRRIAEARLFLC